MLKEGREHRAKTGKSLMVPRYDIVPIPPHLRNNLAATPSTRSRRRPRRACSISAPTTWSAGLRRVRCCCCTPPTIRSRPTEQSIELFKRAGQPTELHLISDADHFMFGEGNTRVWDLLRGWLGDYFPAAKAAVEERSPRGAGH